MEPVEEVESFDESNLGENESTDEVCNSTTKTSDDDSRSDDNERRSSGSERSDSGEVKIPPTKKQSSLTKLFNTSGSYLKTLNEKIRNKKVANTPVVPNSDSLKPPENPQHTMKFRTLTKALSWTFIRKKGSGIGSEGEEGSTLNEEGNVPNPELPSPTTKRALFNTSDISPKALLHATISNRRPRSTMLSTEFTPVVDKKKRKSIHEIHTFSPPPALKVEELVVQPTITLDKEVEKPPKGLTKYDLHLPMSPPAISPVFYDCENDSTVRKSTRTVTTTTIKTIQRKPNEEPYTTTTTIIVTEPIPDETLELTNVKDLTNLAQDSKDSIETGLDNTENSEAIADFDCSEIEEKSEESPESIPSPVKAICKVEETEKQEQQPLEEPATILNIPPREYFNNKLVKENNKKKKRMLWKLQGLTGVLLAARRGIPMFAQPIAKIAQLEGEKVPVVVDFAIKYLDQHLHSEGLFRISGNQEQIQWLKGRFNKWKSVDIADIQDPHVVASLLKLYFRELPEPLLTFHLHEEFLAQLCGDEQERVKRMKEVVKRLPPTNYHVAKALFSFLNRVASFSSQNLMTVDNLAIIFGPTLMRSREDSGKDANLVFIMQLNSLSSVIGLLIAYCHEIFECENELPSSAVNSLATTIPRHNQTTIAKATNTLTQHFINEPDFQSPKSQELCSR